MGFDIVHIHSNICSELFAYHAANDPLDVLVSKQLSKRMTFVISFAFSLPFRFVLVHIPEYVCHGSWAENDTTFIIARHAGTKHGVCISFRPSTTDSIAAQLIVGDSCYRETISSEIPEHHLVSNVTGAARE